MRDTLRSPRQIVLRKELRALRERHRLTQEELASRLGKPQSFVSKYEGGERRLSVIEFIDVVRAIGEMPARTGRGTIGAKRHRRQPSYVSRRMRMPQRCCCHVTQS